MYGLSVRWSLVEAPAEVAAQLRAYVVGPSLTRFTAMPGLSFKSWRMTPGQWFEGTYVFATEAARAEFVTAFGDGSTSAVTAIVAAGPVEIAPHEVVAVAEGGEGFVPGPGPSR